MSASQIAAAVIAGRLAHPAAYGVLFCEDLVSMIVSWIGSDGQLVACRRIGRLWNVLCAKLLPNRYNIDRDLESWFTRILVFRRLQAQLNFYLSGSFGLNVFRKLDNNNKPTLGPHADLDIFIEWDQVHHLAWFVKDEGFQLDTCFDNPPPSDAPSSVSVPDDSFVYVMRFSRGDRRIDLVCTRGTPLYCIFSFHCTLVTNIVSWDKAICVFPFDTLVRGRGLVLRINNDRTRAALKKYERRGYELIQFREGTTGRFSDALGAFNRSLGDARCWVRDLDTTGVMSQYVQTYSTTITFVTPSPYPIQLNCFFLRYVPVQGPARVPSEDVWMPSLDCCILEDYSLSHSYVVTHVFRTQVGRFISRLKAVIGDSWYHRTPHIERDLELLMVHQEYNSIVDDPSHVPHVLYG